MWIVILITAAILLFALFSNNNIKKPPQNLYSKVISPDIQRTNEAIERSRKLLKGIEEQKKIKIASFKNSETFELTGIHIANRKNRIKKTCEENDEIIVSPEPKNKFDRNAIMIENYDGKIGYIKSEDTYEVHQLIGDDHYSFISLIDDFDNFLTVEITILY
jgi:hypothetical protein